MFITTVSCYREAVFFAFFNGKAQRAGGATADNAFQAAHVAENVCGNNQCWRWGRRIVQKIKNIAVYQFFIQIFGTGNVKHGRRNVDADKTDFFRFQLFGNQAGTAAQIPNQSARRSDAFLYYLGQAVIQFFQSLFVGRGKIVKKFLAKQAVAIIVRLSVKGGGEMLGKDVFWAVFKPVCGNLFSFLRFFPV